MNAPLVHSFFDPATWTVSHVVADPLTKKAAIIDPVLDFEPHTGRTKTDSAQKLLDLLQAEGYDCEWIIETHAHADHLSSAQFLKEETGAKVAIGESIRIVQKTFAPIFDVDPSWKQDGSEFDYLFKDGETFKIGALDAKAMYVPGHTPADMAYLIGDALFAGDTIFMPDFGTARCDFPGGDASKLYDSIQKIFTLPEETRLFMCHDYLPDGRSEYLWETTIGEEKHKNIHVGAGQSKEEFVAMREKRDTTLDLPRLLIPSVQFNMRAGKMPLASNGVAYLKMPMNLL